MKRSIFNQLLKRFKRNNGKHISHSTPKKGNQGKVYTLDDKIQILKELEQSGAPVAIFAKWKGIGLATIIGWQNAYKEQGLKGLEHKDRSIKSTLPAEVIEKIIRMKKDDPQMGPFKISEYLARHDFVKVSFGAIRNLLLSHPETKDLMPERPDPRNPAVYKPKSFERSKPRQMFQMDITPWKLKGLYTVYVIGCIDDYSRYMVSWGIFRKQTSEHCIEVLRNAIEQYNSTPEEVLTDNGRQFYTWRGKNDFQRFVLKMGIKHIRSRPYHPQTLGKIESFWRNMYQELLSRETITSFEDMQEKMKKYIDHYNFKRPHQGIGGLVPADRFFGVDKQIKEAMLEGAGMVKDALVVDPYRLSRPMYLIGRIGNKEIRVLAKDGSVIVQGVESIEKKTLPDDKKVEENSSHGEQISPPDSGGNQEPSDSIGLDQSQNGQTSLPGTGHQQGDLLQMGAEGQNADKSGGRAAEIGTSSAGLCAAGAGESGIDSTKTGDPKAKEGEQTTTQNQ
jgi:putative transposase